MVLARLFIRMLTLSEKAIGEQWEECSDPV